MTYFGITDKGSVRAVNQDAFRAEDVPERGAAALVLCDGMGGERAGEVASETAAGAFAEYALERFSDAVPPLADDTAREGVCVEVAGRQVPRPGTGLRRRIQEQARHEPHVS